MPHIKPYSKGHGVFIKGRFIPPPTYGKNEEGCNVTQACKLCSCGEILYYLITDKALAPGTELVAREHGLHLRAGRYLVAQFDGSCHFAGTAYAAAGCGVVLWLIADLCATPLVQMSIPLPHARSAPQSEACGSAYAVRIIAKWLGTNPDEEFDSITIQGDNLSIISNWIGSGRLKQNEMHALLEDAYRIVRYQLSNIHWEYIPRDINKVADYLAGKASHLVRSVRRELLTDPLIPTEQSTPFTYDQTTWKSKAITALENNDRYIILVEKLGPISEYAANLQIKLPDKCRNLHAFLAMQTQYGTTRAYPVQYSTKSAENQGRAYAVGSHAASNASKAIRILAAAQNHTELDVIGSHLSLALIISPVLARAFPFDNVVQAREGLKAMIQGNRYANRHPNYYKDIWNHALNTPVHNLKSSLMNKGLIGIPDLLKIALDAIETSKTDIIKQATAMGFVDTESRINSKNIVYFALEFVEGVFMRHFIANILRTCEITSMDSRWHLGLPQSRTGSSACS